MNAKKVLATAVAVLMLAVTLTGCGMTREEALQIPGTVIELTNATLTNQSTFGYVDNNGEIVPLPDCGWPSLFEQYYCQSEDGVRVFKYSSGKYGISSATFTVDGVKHDMSCEVDPDSGWDTTEICVVSQ